LDGTIVNLNINWHKLKQIINTLCLRNDIDLNAPLNTKIDKLKNITSEICQILYRYEQPADQVYFKPNNLIIQFIKRLDYFYLITNNLHSTAAKVLYEIGLQDKCVQIIGIDDIKLSKPNIDAYIALKTKLSAGQTVYVGDK
jgi:phosphoglycolate phosphatase-like HAD superfamily hydrolase